MVDFESPHFVGTLLLRIKQVPSFARGSDEKYYVHVYVSFQCTGCKNINMVNATDKVNLYVRLEKRGRGDKKRIWAIEMSKGRGTYIGGYGSVDT